MTDANGNRVGAVTMEEGSTKTVVVPLLKGDINFIWNHGWFYGTDYDTDAECAFIIKNSEDEVLYTSSEHSDGVFLSYNNDCGSHIGVSEASANNARLYPNPTNGLLNIEGNGEMTISVLNVLGQKILETTATDNAVLDLSGYESGIYMVRIGTANGTMTEKVNVRR